MIQKWLVAKMKPEMIREMDERYKQLEQKIIEREAAIIKLIEAKVMPLLVETEKQLMRSLEYVKKKDDVVEVQKCDPPKSQMKCGRKAMSYEERIIKVLKKNKKSKMLPSRIHHAVSNIPTNIFREVLLDMTKSGKLKHENNFYYLGE